jgi:8-oxo-dGTP pyrophosphatase MutT (NUDIX family)
VAAVRIFVETPDHRILLVRRASSVYGNGQWCLPGGKIEYCDSPERTVEKELEEETGLAARNISFLFYQDSPPLAPGKMHCLNLYFRCSADGTATLNDESSEFVWVPLQEAMGYAPVFGAEEAIRRLLGESGPQ